MKFNSTIQALSVAAIFALAGCTGTEAPSEPAPALSKTSAEIPKTGCGPIDDMATAMTDALTCFGGDFEDCFATLIKETEPVLKCYNFEIPSGFDSEADFQEWGEELGEKAKEYADPGKQKKLLDCVCGEGASSGITSFTGSASTSATGFSSSSSTSGTGFSSSSSTSGTGFSSSSSTAGTGFSAK